MAVSCPEVMYGAYYPYLYGRGAARSFHHATPFQYERFNVGSGSGGCGAADGYGGGGVALSSAGSASSGAHSPPSPPHAHHAPASAPAPPTPGAQPPPRLRAKEEELSTHGRASADGGGSSESEGECGETGGGARGRAQYFSANCVVFTHYSGDVATVVDEHFARALSCAEKGKESSPLSARNLPASFFDSSLCAGAGAGGAGVAGDLYDYHHDPWHQHYQQYTAAAAHHHRAVQEYHAHAHAHAHAHHNMGGYGTVGGLLLGGARLPHAHAHAQYKGAVDWSGHQHATHHLDPAAYSYPAMPGDKIFIILYCVARRAAVGYFNCDDLGDVIAPAKQSIPACGRPRPAVAPVPRKPCFVSRRVPDRRARAAPSSEVEQRRDMRLQFVFCE
ncbi:Protein vestigial [Eumeta japonica]|uniref:Protein vestigial n=1 Tax=Eumeta variegata TaxID=151549 RepID=A0A4C1XM42_EUMVA|nr:Protein vestigial [Eumeta japonica]